MIETESVSPCMYCATKAEVLPHGMPGMESWQVACPKCQTAGPVTRYLQTAIAAWNGMARGVEMYQILCGRGGQPA